MKKVMSKVMTFLDDVFSLIALVVCLFLLACLDPKGETMWEDEP